MNALIYFPGRKATTSRGSKARTDPRIGKISSAVDSLSYLHHKIILSKLSTNYQITATIYPIMASKSEYIEDMYTCTSMQTGLSIGN
jgi:hypothetical protein